MHGAINEATRKVASSSRGLLPQQAVLAPSDRRTSQPGRRSAASARRAIARYRADGEDVRAASVRLVTRLTQSLGRRSPSRITSPLQRCSVVTEASFQAENPWLR
jgi:hypothetical protein